MSKQFKVGDKVYEKQYEEFGFVESINYKSSYPVKVNFNGMTCEYTLDGRYFINNVIRLINYSKDNVKSNKNNNIKVTKSLFNIIKSFFKKASYKSINITVKKINSAKIIIN